MWTLFYPIPFLVIWLLPEARRTQKPELLLSEVKKN